MMKTLEERFWEKVDKSGECWEWTACKNSDGYGQFRVDGKGVKAHRVSWELTNGPIPEGVHCLHRCDNPGCTRPDHLFLGTHTDNMRDMFTKGRRSSSMGEDHYCAKLTEDNVRVIRKVYGYGLATQKTLSILFGVKQAAIKKVVNHQSWKHIT